MPSTLDSPLLDIIPYLFRRLSTELNTVIVKDLKPYKINLPRWRIIAVLHFCGGVNIGELARLTSLTQPGTSQIIDKLVAEEVVERRIRKDDNRIMQISLSVKGEQLFNNIFPIIQHHQNNLTSDFTPTEKNLFISLCRRMVANSEKIKPISGNSQF